MFVSHDMKSNKRKFQKPNILRRKQTHNKSLIIHTLDKTDSCESQDLKTLLPSTFLVDPKSKKLKEQKYRNTTDQFSVGKSVSKTDTLTLDLSNTQDVGRNISAHNSLIYIDSIQQNNNELSQNQTLNVEPFLVGNVINQNDPVSDRQNKEIEIQAKQQWCINLVQNPETIIIRHIDDIRPGYEGYVGQKPEKLTNAKPLVQQESAVLHGDTLTPENDTQTLSIEQLIRITTKFKCDIPNCDKEFASKQKLNKHVMSVHNKDKNVKSQRQITVACPVKRVLESGVEELCGRIFHVREDLMKHLSEEHTIEEALYSCAQCGRRFFWASGLRAHARAHLVRAARTELACPWPGCGRVFRQPCRLREHSRAHTGDRPYPCLFPECGWSFRTASKLVRHARRHTGERRHECGACGRAFLRREHLRDHAQRHAAPQRRAKHACPAADCQQSFTNMSSLYMHMKKVHKKKESEESVGAAPPAAPPAPRTGDHEMTRIKAENMFMVSLLEPGESTEIDQSTGVRDTLEEALGEELGEAGDMEEVGEMEEVEEMEEVGEEEEVGEAEEVEEGHSARTHCTWPLPRALHYQPSAYVLEEDIQVEQSDGAESNIYTVRSDLFLHGNVLHNEDSEQMAQCARLSADEGGGEDGAAEAAGGAALELDADLLLDAPSVHLDQEELYTDVVDESSFRVFLLSGEELVIPPPPVTPHSP